MAQKPLTQQDQRIAALGLAVRDARLQAGISQEKLAEAALLHRNVIGRVERGETIVTISTLFGIADALGVSASSLLRGAEQLKNEPLHLPLTGYG